MHSNFHPCLPHSLFSLEVLHVSLIPFNYPTGVCAATKHNLTDQYKPMQRVYTAVGNGISLRKIFPLGGGSCQKYRRALVA